jgi:hypothetical protein
MPRALTLTPPTVQRGRMLTVDHILALLPEKRSRWWVLTKFLPDEKKKLGKMVYWWEDAVRKVLYVPDTLPVVTRGQAA